MLNSNYKINRVGIFLGVAPSHGGMFQYAQSLLEALVSAGDSHIDVVVVYTNFDWMPILENLGIDGHRLHHSRIGTVVANIFMAIRLPCSMSRLLGFLINPLIRELKSFKCNVWIFPAQESLSWQISGVKVIGTIHDLMHRYESRFPEVGSSFRYEVREHRFSNIAKYCDIVLVDSKVGKKQVIESYGIKSDKVCPLPYIAPSQLRNPIDGLNVIERYKLPQKYLFYPAQFWAHKNHYKLIDALSILSLEYPDIYLVLSGKFTNIYKNVYRHASKKGVIDKIRFLGYVPQVEMRELYKCSRALIYPTFLGPTNIPPLEAFSLGCPAIISNIYGMPEQCGDAALYFDPSDAIDMAKNIKRVWVDDDLVSKMIKKGYEMAAINNQSNFNNKFIEILNKAIAS